MPVVQGLKVACGPCIRGHRSTKCQHGDERVMLLVRKPGRPLSACPHPRDIPCNCSSVTLGIPMRANCPCPSEASKSVPKNTVPGNCCTPSTSTPTGDLPSPTRNEYRVTRGFPQQQSSRKQSYDPSNFARMSLDTMNVVSPSQNGSVDFGNGFAPPSMYTPSPAGFASSPNGYSHPYPPPPPGYASSPNGFPQPPIGYAQSPYPPPPIGSAVSSMGLGQQEQQFGASFYNAGPQYPAQYNNYGAMSSGPAPYQSIPAPSNGFVPQTFQPFDDMAGMNQPMPMINHMSNGVPQAQLTNGLPNGEVKGSTFEDVFAAQPDGPSPESASEMSEPPEPKSCCASKAAPGSLKKEELATPVIMGSHTPPDMQESYSHNTIAPAVLGMQPPPQDQQPLSVLLNQHQQQYVPAAALPYGSFENPAQPSTWRQNMQPSYTSEAQNAATPSPFNHVCCCGDTCTCVGCLSHPFNKPMEDYAQLRFPSQDADSHDSPQGVANDDRNSFDSPNKETLSSPALTPTAGGGSEDQNLSATNFFWIRLPMNGCQGLESICGCGPGCECDGCELHDPKRIGQ